MQAGQLRRQVTIQRRDTTVDATGQRSEAWTAICTTMADVQPLSGRELEIAQAVVAGVDHTVTIRYRPGITAAMRLLYEGRAFAIERVVDVDMRHRTLQLACREGLNDGR